MSRPSVLLTLLLCGASLSIGPLQAAEEGFVPKSVDVPRLTEPVRIDGKLDEAFWQRAVPIRDFEQFTPGNGEPPSETTEFFLARDEENLYIGARLADREPGLIKRSQLVQGQGVFNDDYIELLLDTYNDRRTGYIFYVNPNGVQRDGLLLGGLSFNMDWDGIWQAAASVNETGWEAEIALPFKTLAFDRQGDVWGLNLIRSIRRKREDVAWSQRNRRITLDLSNEIRGMRGLDQGRGLDLVPSAALTERESFLCDRGR